MKEIEDHDGVTEVRDEFGFDILYEAILHGGARRFTLDIATSKWTTPNDIARFLTIFAGKLKDKTAFVASDESEDQ